MKRWSVMLLVFVMVSSLLAGCGGNSGTKGEASSTGDLNASSTPPSSSSNEKVTLQLAHFMGEEGARLWIEDFIAEFESQNPNVKVEVIATNNDNYNTMLKTKIASDDAPDIMLLARLSGSDKAYVDEGYVLDLTGQPFLENIQGIERHQIDGKVYGMPFDLNAYGVMYNKDVFAKAGITEVPRTYSAFMQTLETLKQAGITPISAGYKELNVLQSELTSDIMNSLVVSNPKFALEAEARTIKFTNNEAVGNLLKRAAERFKYTQRDPFGTDRTTYASLVATGQAAMLINGSWMIDAIKAQNPDVNLGFFPYPYSENEEDNKLPLGTGVGGWAIYKDSPNKEWALKLFELISSKEMGMSLQKNKKAVSVVKGLGAATDPTFQDIDQYNSSNQVFDYTGTYANFTPEYDNALLQQVSAFLMSSSPNVEDTLKKLDEEFDRIYKLNK